MLHVKGLVIGFYLGFSNQKNIMKVGSKSLLLTCSSNKLWAYLYYIFLIRRESYIFVTAILVCYIFDWDRNAAFAPISFEVCTVKCYLKWWHSIISDVIWATFLTANSARKEFTRSKFEWTRKWTMSLEYRWNKSLCWTFSYGKFPHIWNRTTQNVWRDEIETKYSGV